MKKLAFSACFIIVFMVASFTMLAVHFQTAVSKTESPTLDSIMYGKWSPVFEKNLNESLPVFEPSRTLWGKIEFALFKEGRSGVLVGEKGWLFTNEEFSCPSKWEENTAENLDYIGKASQAFEEKGIKLYVVLVPAKVRVYSDMVGKNVVPACRAGLYGDIMKDLHRRKISAVALLDAFKAAPDREELYLKTDTHWTTQGARMASVLVSAEVDLSALARKSFSSTQGEKISHSGDLLRYLPGVETAEIHPDDLQAFDTQEVKEEGAEEDASQSLFGDDIPPVTLVGTSYSANPAWHFHGFLKAALDVDILNMADEGQGPFTVMEKYLTGDALKNTPPAVVIWEIPERYVPVKTKFSDNKS